MPASSRLDLIRCVKVKQAIPIHMEYIFGYAYARRHICLTSVKKLLNLLNVQCTNVISAKTPCKSDKSHVNLTICNLKVVHRSSLLR